MSSEKDGKSFHIFLFPFQWDIKTENKKIEETPLCERINIKRFDTLLEKSCWERDKFVTDSPEKYNQYIYFHNFVREMLFDRNYHDDNNNDKDLLRSYRLHHVENGTYCIDVKEPEKNFELKIDKVLLNIYATGMGVLSYHLRNDSYDDLDDILLINDYGRRIFPQFLSKSQNKDGKKMLLSENVKKAFLADKLEIKYKRNGKDVSIWEHFSYFDESEKVYKNPFRLSHTVSNILGKPFVTSEKDAVLNDVVISPILDDRMFVMCWTAQKEIAEKLSKYTKLKKQYNYLDPKKNDDWYRYVFIDGKYVSCPNIHMKSELLARHTYARWVGYETLYGVTRNSFMILAPSSILVLDHLKTMYYRMVNLALVQRASILRFSAETTRIARLENSDNTFHWVKELQEKYLEFVNRVYFREVTAQEQGIELYDHIQRAMNIERDVKDLNTEINQLHQYTGIKKDRRNNRLLNRLSILAALFVVPAFITGFFGMNIFSEKKLTISYSWNTISVLIDMLLIAILGWVFISHRNRSDTHKFSWKEKLLLIVMTILLIAILALPFWNCILPGGN